MADQRPRSSCPLNESTRIALPTSSARPALPAAPGREQLRVYRPFMERPTEVARVFVTANREVWHLGSWQAEAVFQLSGDVWQFVRMPKDRSVEPPPQGPYWRCHWSGDATVIVPRSAFAQPWFDVALDAYMVGDRAAIRTIAAEFIPTRVLAIAESLVAKVGRQRMRSERRAEIEA